MEQVVLVFDAICQNEQIRDANDPNQDYLYARIVFRIFRQGQPYPAQVIVRQPRGTNFLEDPVLEIGPVEGPYKGPFARVPFEELVTRYYRICLERFGSPHVASTSPATRVISQGNLYHLQLEPVVVEVEQPIELDGGWLLPGERRRFKQHRPRSTPAASLETPKRDDNVAED